MKYAQLIIGLLAGTALGGSVVAATDSNSSSGKGLDKEAVKAVVRQVISDEPQLIIESVQKLQMAEQKKQQANMGESLKDDAVREQVYHDKNAASTGPKDSKRVVVEFFDYNCGACKYMFKSLQALVEKDKTARVVFHEYPIFGPTSEENSKIGVAVNRLYPEKYFDFYVKMMSASGHVDAKAALGFAKELGMDEEKLKTEAAKKEVSAVLEANRVLGEKLHIQGTPTLVIGDEVVPHALSLEDLEEKLSASEKGKAAPAKKAE